MILTLIIKNLFFLLKNCLTILNLIKNKNVYYLILFISIYLFILPNVAYCETVDIEKPEMNELEMSIEERKRLREYEYNKRVENLCLFIFAIGFTILWWNFLDYFFEDGNDSDFSDFSSDIDELPEVKEPHEPYVQGPGHHFFVWDMGIVYEDPKPLSEAYIQKLKKAIEHFRSQRK